MIFHYYSVGGTNNRQQKEFWEGGGGTQIDVSSFHLFLVGYVRIGRGKQKVSLALFLVVFGWNGRLFFLIFFFLFLGCEGLCSLYYSERVRLFRMAIYPRNVTRLH